MQLYEVQNGWMGESIVRAYVWASNRDEAQELATEAFKVDAVKYHRTSAYYDKLYFRLLLETDHPSFCTKPSDSGWDI